MRTHPTPWSLTLWLLAAASSGCGSLLDVKAPSRVDADSLEQPDNAALLVAGAVSDFECALGRYILGAGLVGDEFQDAQLASAMWPYDQRTFTSEGGQYATSTCNEGAIGVYTPLSTARWQADNALNRLENWTDDQVAERTALIAKAAAYSGYAHVLMGEGMCSAAFDLGPELSRAEIFARAEDRFTTAIAAAQASGQTALLNMALVGRARARLNLGRKTDAAADAALVPTGFVMNATYSGTAARRENPIFTRNIRDGSVTIEDDFRGLTFGGVPDARTSVTYAGISRSDNITPLWTQAKYTSVSSPIPIATWDEAQLILAEAALGQTAVDIINMFHTRAGLPLFSSNDDVAILAQVTEERGRELFLESHHLGDKIRYGLAFTPAPGTPYPPKAGGLYGSMTCFPLPDVERLNNPNITGG